VAQRIEAVTRDLVEKKDSRGRKELVGYLVEVLQCICDAAA
jgi:hypothetical protein